MSPSRQTSARATCPTCSSRAPVVIESRTEPKDGYVADPRFGVPIRGVDEKRTRAQRRKLVILEAAARASLLGVADDLDAAADVHGGPALMESVGE